MLGALLVSLVVPQPSPSPSLKTIIHVHSSPFCTTLRQNVGRAVAALIQNNIAIDETKSLLLKMARDKVSSANRNMVIDMDMDLLGPKIDQIAHNLAVAQALLNDAHAFSGQPQSDDNRRLTEMKQQLQAVIDHQNQALNIVSGTFYSYNGNRLMGYGDGLKAPVDPLADTPIVLPPIKSSSNTKRLNSPSPSPLPAVSPVPATSPLSSGAPLPAATPTSVDLGLLGMTKFATLFNNLTTYQVNEQSLESQAAATILQSTAECNGTQQ